MEFIWKNQLSITKKAYGFELRESCNSGTDIGLTRMQKVIIFIINSFPQILMLDVSFVMKYSVYQNIISQTIGETIGSIVLTCDF